MGAWLAAAFGTACYVFFLATFLCAIGFVGNLPALPKTIDGGVPGPLGEALVVDARLLGLFAIQHSVMARRSFKRWWTRLIAPAIERSVYVLAASLALVLLFWQWRSIDTVVWHVQSPLVVALMQGVFWSGWGVLLISTFLINHFELFGLRQVFAHLTNRPLPPPTFKTPLFYRHVRHPIYAGFLLAFWSAPTMSAGHLLFSVATTAYILVGIFFEERDLIQRFGDRYRAYRRQVGMLWPRAGKARGRDAAAG